jgi:hypothetical protein
MPEIQLELQFVEYATANIAEDELELEDDPELFNKLIEEEDKNVDSQPI